MNKKIVAVALVSCAMTSALARFTKVTGPWGVSYYDIPTNKASRVVMTNGVVLVTVPKQVVQDSECERIPVATTNAQGATPIVDDLHPLTNSVDICSALGIDEAQEQWPDEMMKESKTQNEDVEIPHVYHPGHSRDADGTHLKDGHPLTPGKDFVVVNGDHMAPSGTGRFNPMSHMSSIITAARKRQKSRFADMEPEACLDAIASVMDYWGKDAVEAASLEYGMYGPLRSTLSTCDQTRMCKVYCSLASAAVPEGTRQGEADVWWRVKGLGLSEFAGSIAVCNDTNCWIAAAREHGRIRQLRARGTTESPQMQSITDDMRAHVCWSIRVAFGRDFTHSEAFSELDPSVRSSILQEVVELARFEAGEIEEIGIGRFLGDDR